MQKKVLDELNTKLDNLAKMFNGGPGSGNWGHQGRPGEVGGSSKKGVVESKDSGIGRADGPDITQHIANTATANIDKANKEEPEVSKTLGDVFEKNGASFTGFDFRVKTKSSLADKISRDLVEKNKKATPKNIEGVAREIHDNLRYTALCNKDTFGKQYQGIMKDLESRGYEVMRVKNTLKDADAPYRGVNTLVKNKNGYIFELQFHTPQSVDVKEKNHIDYNVARDTKTPLVKKMKLEKQMKARSKSIEMPKGVEDIEPINKMRA